MTKREEIQSWLTSEILKLKDLILLCSIRIGKAKTSLDAIEPNESVLIVYPLVEIQKGWKEDLIKFPPKSTNITFSTTHGLKKFKDQYFDFIILDEPQLYSKAQRDIIKTLKYTKRVALTGTLKYSTKTKLKEELNLEVKAEYTLDQAIADGIVKDYKIFVHMWGLDNDIRDISYVRYAKPSLGSDREVYDYYLSIMESTETMQNRKVAMAVFRKYQSLLVNHIYNSPSLFICAKNIANQNYEYKTLIYSMRTEIVERLSSGLTYTSKNRNKEVLDLFKESKSGHLGVVNCIQAGVTIKNLNKVLIHSTESNTEKFQQKIGRSLLYDFNGNYSEIHVCCLKDTIMERWINLGLSSLNQNKITFIYEGKEYSKVEWLKFNNPGKELFQYYNGGICYLLDKEQRTFSNYCFIDNPTNNYSLNREKLIRI